MQNYIKDLLEHKQGFEIDFVKQSAPANMPVGHCHTHYEIYIQMQGGRCYFLKDRLYHIHEGDIVIISPGILHKTTDLGPSYERLLIDFDKKFLVELKNITEDLNIFECFLEDYLVITPTMQNKLLLKELCLRIIQEKKQQTKGYRTACKLLIWELILLFNRCHMEVSEADFLFESQSYRKISDILSYINDHFSENITLEEISKKFYISYYYLSHIFKEVTGLTFVEYVNLLKISKAKNLLREGRLSLELVSEQAGFGSYKQFGRIFKQITGVSPSQYK